MIFIFWLITLVFFKVVTKFGFDHDMTVLAAAIASAVYSWLMLSAQLAAARTIDTSALRIAADDRAFFRALALPYAIAATLSVGATVLIVYGFSDRLAADLFRSYGHETELMWFLGIACIPAVAHGAMSAAVMREMLRKRW
ncbi:hypothetical protein [Paenirhodobacter sp. CAU 1674]|uniref:hypothetical protein n=1 Tax=Paenirhodobacter sp. CAU 1674 TaxID=3032596 RepID=UPI0023D9C3F0|nr:hypothetical protein [Paenirhodobacter sp. CAU 1674]MDF2143230.1 hypothetical protein [Paenirhodobacter sp. CAU 1674]